MGLIAVAYTHFCGEGRYFVVDGVALPVCQRCLGLFTGAALTGVWLFSSGVWRRGLPSRRMFLIHAAILLAAMLGGIHVIDFGQSWRLLCGLWTGFVVVLWLVGGTRHLWHASLRGAPVGLAWSQRDELHSTLATAVLTGLAFAIPRWLLLGRYVWTALIIAGAVVLVLSVAGSEVATARWCVRGIRDVCAATARPAGVIERTPKVTATSRSVTRPGTKALWS